MLQLLFFETPRALRRDSRLFWLVLIVFFLSLVVAFISVQINSQSVLLVYDKQQLLEFKRMFHPQWQEMSAQQLSNTKQFIFYALNNNWVGIQLFLLGILFGVGTLIYLAYTGFSLGLMMGYLSAAGYNDTLWPSIMTHSSFEVLATLIAAVAGIKWGFSLVLLGNPLRRHEFGIRFAQSVILLINAMLFFILAALIEAYWSAGFIVSMETKYVTGIFSWALLIGYLLFIGRTASRNENG